MPTGPSPSSARSPGDRIRRPLDPAAGGPARATAPPPAAGPGSRGGKRDDPDYERVQVLVRRGTRRRAARRWEDAHDGAHDLSELVEALLAAYARGDLDVRDVLRVPNVPAAAEAAAAGRTPADRSELLRALVEAVDATGVGDQLADCLTHDQRVTLLTAKLRR